MVSNVRFARSRTSSSTPARCCSCSSWSRSSAFVWQRFKPQFVLVWLLGFYVLIGIAESIRALAQKVLKRPVARTSGSRAFAGTAEAQKDVQRRAIQGGSAIARCLSRRGAPKALRYRSFCTSALPVKMRSLGPKGGPHRTPDPHSNRPWPRPRPEVGLGAAVVLTLSGLVAARSREPAFRIHGQTPLFRGVTFRLKRASAPRWSRRTAPARSRCLRLIAGELAARPGLRADRERKHARVLPAVSRDAR